LKMNKLIKMILMERRSWGWIPAYAGMTDWGRGWRISGRHPRECGDPWLRVASLTNAGI